MKTKAFARLLVTSLVVVAIAAAGFLWTEQRPVYADLSHAARNSLNETSVKILSAFPGPLEILVFVPAHPELRRGISDFLARFQRLKKNLDVRFVDPGTELETVRRYGANLGEIVLHVDGRTERINALNEHEVVNAIARLSRAPDRHIVFLNGNGERRISRQANHDLSTFAAYLRQRGLSLKTFDPASGGEIPAQTALLVIASPAVAYAPGDIEMIVEYVTAGGNLLWLGDPKTKPGTAGLAEHLGIAALPGTVVDPVGLTRFRNAAFAVAANHPPHPSLQGFQETVVFPYAQGLLPHALPGFEPHILVRTTDNAWTETGPFEGNVGFDAEDEVQGSLALALALTKSRGVNSEQRMVVIGDGDFVSNTFVENQGNLEFARRVVEWLVADDHMIDIGLPQVEDAVLDLDMWQRMVVFFVFGLLIPLGCAANAMLYWLRQRHA